MRYPKRKGLPCPECGHSLSKITDSRPTHNNTTIRRSCMKCKFRWTTWESSDFVIRNQIKDEIKEEIQNIIKIVLDSIDWGKYE